MGRKKIGLTSGLNPLPALKMKSCLIGVGAKLDLPVEVVESNAELPLDAPTPLSLIHISEPTRPY